MDRDATVYDLEDDDDQPMDGESVGDQLINRLSELRPEASPSSGGTGSRDDRASSTSQRQKKSELEPDADFGERITKKLDRADRVLYNQARVPIDLHAGKTMFNAQGQLERRESIVSLHAQSRIMKSTTCEMLAVGLQDLEHDDLFAAEPQGEAPGEWQKFRDDNHPHYDAKW